MPVPLGYPKRLSVVTHEKKILGFNHRMKHYVIGFQQPIHAHMVARTMCKQTLDNIMLMRHYVDDVSDDINAGLRQLGMDEVRVDDVTIDVCSTLIVPRKNTEKLLKVDVGEIDFEEFLMFPFTRHIGVALPYEIVEDSEKQVVFQSQIIDPTQDVESFRRNLSF